MALSPQDKISIAYHDIFAYPLNKKELIKWKAGKRVELKKKKIEINSKKGFYFIKGREEIIDVRLKKLQISNKKLSIAKKAASLLIKIPTIRFIGLTGSLAMQSASENSDIDLLLITSQGNLWTTRLVSYFLLFLTGYKLRRARDKNEKDRLCLNIWLDERDLIWRDKNIFTAHEVCQIKPLKNKDNTYKRFLWANRWVLEYWPMAVQIKKVKEVQKNFILNIFEGLAYFLQYQYMKPKITREVVTATRAVFHPNDWSKKVISKL